MLPTIYFSWRALICILMFLSLLQQQKKKKKERNLLNFHHISQPFSDTRHHFSFHPINAQGRKCYLRGFTAILPESFLVANTGLSIEDTSPTSP